MDCRRFRIVISREVDGESNVADREELARHIESCRDCRAFSALVRSATAAHRSIPEVSPDPRLLGAILARATEKRGFVWSHGWLRLAMPAAAVAVFVLGFWIGSVMHEHYRGATTSVANAAGGTGQLDLEYLGECPPGSFGSVLDASYEGGAR